MRVIGVEESQSGWNGITKGVAGHDARLRNIAQGRRCEGAVDGLINKGRAAESISQIDLSLSPTPARMLQITLNEIGKKKNTFRFSEKMCVGLRVYFLSGNFYNSIYFISHPPHTATL